MILITGGTGFIGRALIKRLLKLNVPIRVIIRPSKKSPKIPQSIPVEVAISNLNEPQKLRAAMVGVDVIYHLAGVEQKGAYGDLMAVDIRGTQALLNAACDAGVKHFFYLSHLGADRYSAYPIMKAKAIAEEQIRKSGIDYTIFRSSIVYGRGDSFTSGLARLIHFIPFAFFTPGDGRTLIQPLWIEDLITCMVWALDDEQSKNKLFEIGGPEQLMFIQVLEALIDKLGVKRRIFQVFPPYIRGLTVFFETLFPGLPVSVFWLDYLAVNRICALDSIPRAFKLIPERFSQQIDYIKDYKINTGVIRSLFQR